MDGLVHWDEASGNNFFFKEVKRTFTLDIKIIQIAFKDLGIEFMHSMSSTVHLCVYNCIHYYHFLKITERMISSDKGHILRSDPLFKMKTIEREKIITKESQPHKWWMMLTDWRILAKGKEIGNLQHRYHFNWPQRFCFLFNRAKMEYSILLLMQLSLCSSILFWHGFFSSTKSQNGSTSNIL